MTRTLTRDVLVARLGNKTRAVKTLQRGRSRMQDRLARKAAHIADLTETNRLLANAFKGQIKEMTRLTKANDKLKEAAKKQAAKEKELKNKKSAAESQVKRLRAAAAQAKGKITSAKDRPPRRGTPRRRSRRTRSAPRPLRRRRWSASRYPTSAAAWPSSRSPSRQSTASSVRRARWSRRLRMAPCTPSISSMRASARASTFHTRSLEFGRSDFRT